LGWTIYGSINGWHAERGAYAGFSSCCSMRVPPRPVHA
jgi:hypothetical protein